MVRLSDKLDAVGVGDVHIRADKEGNAYAAFLGAQDRMPYLSISRDGGKRWSTPQNVVAPGLKEAGVVALAANERGQVAVAYMGSPNSPGPAPKECSAVSPWIPPQPGETTPRQERRDAKPCPQYASTTWDAYITETRNALDAQPVFWSAAVSDPKYPIFKGCAPVFWVDADGSFVWGCTTTESRQVNGRTVFMSAPHHFFDVRIWPDGSPWAAFLQYCPGGKPGGPCPATLAGTTNDTFIGLLGRLVRPDTSTTRRRSQQLTRQ
jgi:hypothetical protein